MTTARAAGMLAERISGALTDECLAWGQAINDAEAAKGTGAYEALATLARAHGRRVAELSSAIANKLRPRGGA